MSIAELSDEEFRALLAEEQATLEPDVRAVYARHQVPIRRAAYTWGWDPRPVSKPIWVIARAGVEVVGYDEVEEEYGTGLLCCDAEVTEWGTYGERLRSTLLRFPTLPV